MLKELNSIAAGLLGLGGYPLQPSWPPVCGARAPAATGSAGSDEPIACPRQPLRAPAMPAACPATH